MKFAGIITITVGILAVASAVPIEKRRFGQEHTPRADADFQTMKDIALGTDFGADLGNLSGAAVRALLAKAPACDQQDVADQMIDIGHKIVQQGKPDAQTAQQKLQQLIDVAKDYRTLERNTPKAGQPSELCNRPPKNPELNGLVQAQDPTGDGAATPANGAATTPSGAATTPSGAATTPSGAATTPSGAATTPSGAAPTTPNGAAATDPCKATNPTTTPTGGDTAPTTPTGGDTAPTTPPTTPQTPSNGSASKDASTPGTIITLDNAAFTNPVAGIKPPQIIVNQDGNPSVNGDRFLQLPNAIQRACDVQKNQCFNKFNGGDRSFSSSDCENQQSTCSTGNTVFA